MTTWPPQRPLPGLEEVDFRLGHLENGAPIELFHALHRCDRSRFEVELIRALDSRV